MLIRASTCALALLVPSSWNARLFSSKEKLKENFETDIWEPETPQVEKDDAEMVLVAEIETKLRSERKDR